MQNQKSVQIDNEWCDIGNDKMCRTHNCGTRAIKVTSKKWTRNAKLAFMVIRTQKLPS